MIEGGSAEYLFDRTTLNHNISTSSLGLCNAREATYLHGFYGRATPNASANAFAASSLTTAVPPAT